MRVVRGSTGDIERDRAVGPALLERAAETGETGLHLTTPQQQVAFGRRDAASDGFERACAVAREHDYTPVERDTGGRAVAHTGQTVAFAYAVADDDARGSIRARYRAATSLVARALRRGGARVEPGEPERAYCPGEHSLQGARTERGKIVGIAQRVRDDAALVGGCVTVRERDEADIATVLTPLYDALDVPFDPESVGSVEGSGGSGRVEGVLDALEREFVGTGSVERVAPDELLGRR